MQGVGKEWYKFDDQGRASSNSLSTTLRSQMIEPMQTNQIRNKPSGSLIAAVAVDHEVALVPRGHASVENFLNLNDGLCLEGDEKNVLQCPLQCRKLPWMTINCRHFVPQMN